MIENRAKLAEIIAESLGLPVERVTPEINQETEPLWDSLGHLRLVIAVEERFSVRLPTVKIGEMTSWAAYVRELKALGVEIE